MEDRRVLIDTTILIEYFRNKSKDKSILYNLSRNYILVSSSICYFEFLSGAKEQDKIFIANLFDSIEILSLDKNVAIMAAEVYKQLGTRNLLIDYRDIFIASTAIANNISLATLNKKHFMRIDALKLI